MRYSDSVAICLVFCLVFSAMGQDPAALDALYWKAAQRESGQGAPKDLAAAAALYEQAARQGHVPSMLRLGYLRQSGEGVPQDKAGGLALFSQAAKAGDADGEFFVAMSHAQGVGTSKDPVTARTLLLRPATAGHQSSQYALGIMLELGEGGPKKEAAARRWLDKAAAGPDRELAAKAAGYAGQDRREYLRSGQLRHGVFGHWRLSSCWRERLRAMVATAVSVFHL